jgi:hypothetical protein
VYTVTISHDQWKTPIAVEYDPSKESANTTVTLGQKKLPAITAASLTDAIGKSIAVVFGKLS